MTFFVDQTGERSAWSDANECVFPKCCSKREQACTCRYALGLNPPHYPVPALNMEGRWCKDYYWRWFEAIYD